MDEDLVCLDARADALIDDHDNLLAALVALRVKHGLSQEVIADRMGVSQPSISALERYDANPTLSTIRRYAMAVGARLHTQVIDDTHTTHSTWRTTRRIPLEVIHEVRAAEGAVWSDGMLWAHDPAGSEASV